MSEIRNSFLCSSKIRCISIHKVKAYARFKKIDSKLSKVLTHPEDFNAKFWSNWSSFVDQWAECYDSLHKEYLELLNKDIFVLEVHTK